MAGFHYQAFVSRCHLPPRQQAITPLSEAFVDERARQTGMVFLGAYDRDGVAVAELGPSG
ncbi:MAG TPA: hypothetical protein VFA03_14850 [Acetobacteraceae bacterium]|nr:hypothetical protein [Acetobacteraceae bacterium]